MYKICFIIFLSLTIYPTIVRCESDNIYKNSAQYSNYIHELETINDTQRPVLQQKRNNMLGTTKRIAPISDGRLSAAELTNIAVEMWTDDSSTDVDLVMEYLEAAIKQNINYDNADHNRGIVFYNLGDYDKATIDYTKAIEINSKNAVAYFHRGKAWANKKEPNKAIIDFNKAIILEPHFTEAYGSRGNTWTDLGIYEKAISDYSKVIELNPLDGVAYNNRGFVWLYKGYYKKACDDWEKACERKTCSGIMWSKDKNICW